MLSLLFTLTFLLRHSHLTGSRWWLHTDIKVGGVITFTVQCGGHQVPSCFKFSSVRLQHAGNYDWSDNWGYILVLGWGLLELWY